MRTSTFPLLDKKTRCHNSHAISPYDFSASIHTRRLSFGVMLCSYSSFLDSVIPGRSAVYRSRSATLTKLCGENAQIWPNPMQHVLSAKRHVCDHERTGRAFASGKFNKTTCRGIPMKTKSLFHRQCTCHQNSKNRVCAAGMPLPRYTHSNTKECTIATLVCSPLHAAEHIMHASSCLNRSSRRTTARRKIVKPYRTLGRTTCQRVPLPLLIHYEGDRHNRRHTAHTSQRPFVGSDENTNDTF